MRAIVFAFCRLNTLLLLKLRLKFVQSMDAFAKYILSSTHLRCYISEENAHRQLGYVLMCRQRFLLGLVAPYSIACPSTDLRILKY